MAGQKRDASWLKGQLSMVLGWDELIVEGLVDVVVRAARPGADRSELDEMAQNFMADCPAGVALIEEFLEAPKRPGAGAAGAVAAAAVGKGAGAGAGGGHLSYAASASSAPPATAAAPSGTRSQLQDTYHQQQQQQQQRRQDQQQQRHQPGQAGPRQQAPATGSHGAYGWMALGGPAAASSSASASSTAAAAVVTSTRAAGDGDNDAGDDFSRFVADGRGQGGSGGGKGGRSRGKHGSSQDLQALDASAVGPEKASGQADAGGKVLGMFKAGGRIRAPAAKPVRIPEGGALALAACLERQVMNCLGCGKIYDCRSVSNDVLRFLERGGVCTFCGDAVPLSYKDRLKAAATAAAATTDTAVGDEGRDQVVAGAAGGSTGVIAEDAAAAAARAFKDRLVEYDRNAAKRTTVIDDQSDFFEIDTNAWLTDQEREELRRRQQMEAEAEAARRKRLTVTIDLIGRKVVLDEDVRKAEEAAAAAAAERAAAAAKAAAAAEALRNTDGDGGASSAYGSGVAFCGNILGGMATSGPTREQLAAALESLKRMKASLNPAIAATAAPLFLPATIPGKSGGPSSASTSSTASRRTGPVTYHDGSARSQGSTGRAAGRGPPQPPRERFRVQHDLGAEFGFDAFGAELALDELMGGRLLDEEREEDGPYDICPPDMASCTSYASAGFGTASKDSEVPRPMSGLPPGFMLLKGFLSMDEQIKIIRQIRELGIGHGGFYVPSYSSGGRLALRMMCLGLHWEPRTGKYEPTRSSYDGAAPPPLPSPLVELCGRCLDAASAAAAATGGPRFPAMQPDICLANFYERSGRLGMHQDKDEMADSLRAGLPVVSLSIGDAADFLYGKTRDAEQAKSVRLESGDLLVFGGPARMIFHSVAKIYPNTAPKEVVRATGLRPGRLNLTFRQYRAAVG